MRVLLVLIAGAASCWTLGARPAPAAEASSWQELFDGKSLDGWRQLGGKAKYEARDGAIVGTSVPGTPNSFLATEKTYGDFVLELDFLADEGLNSGVQIRSESRPDYQNGRVHGYQVEIDPAQNAKWSEEPANRRANGELVPAGTEPRRWTGGLYEEGRRGWLKNLTENEPARLAFKPGEWNHFRIEARGDSFKTWLNGVPAAELVDSMTPRGFIALQVHETESAAPMHVRWKNIRLQELASAANGAAEPAATPQTTSERQPTTPPPHDADDERSAYWPQWRGPNADGVAPYGDPPVTWDASTNVKWKAALPGAGSGTPIVWGDRIYLLTAIDTGRQPEATATAAIQEQAPAEGVQEARSEEQRGPLGGPRGDRGDGRRGEGRRGDGRRGGGGFGRGGFGDGPAPRTVYRFDVLCLDRSSGDVVWQKTATEQVPHEGHHETNTFASASCVTDGRLLVASFGSRGIFCFDLDGNLKWQRDLGDMQTRRGFGEGASPALFDDALVVTWDQEVGSFIACLDAETGQERWRQPRDEVSTWATPRVVEHQGVVQVIANGANRTRSYNLATGELVWECGGQAANPIASPVVRNGVAICMTGFRGYALFAISLDSRGDVTGTDKVLWSRTDAGPYVASPLLYDNQLYFTKGDMGILCLVNAETGEPFYSPKRLGELGTIYASPVGAAGRVYLTDREGVTLVLEHGPQYRLLSANRIDETVNASPVIVGKELLLRGEKHLWCFAEGGQATAD